MNEESQYLVWSLEHSKWWRPNACGYTPDVDQAGRFSLEAAESICKNANLFGQVNEELVNENDVLQIKRLEGFNQPVNKKDLNSILEPFNHCYFETNPMGQLLELLKDNHYHPPEDFQVPHVDYETTQRMQVPIENERDSVVNISLYRMPSGNYECVAYGSNGPEIKPKGPSRNRP